MNNWITGTPMRDTMWGMINNGVRNHPTGILLECVGDMHMELMDSLWGTLFLSISRSLRNSLDD